jgi:hypothetical protein
MKRIIIALFLLIACTALHSCYTTCKVPPKDAQGNPTVIQHPTR